MIWLTVTGPGPWEVHSVIKFILWNWSNSGRQLVPAHTDLTRAGDQYNDNSECPGVWSSAIYYTVILIIIIIIIIITRAGDQSSDNSECPGVWSSGEILRRHSSSDVIIQWWKWSQRDNCSILQTRLTHWTLIFSVNWAHTTPGLTTKSNLLSPTPSLDSAAPVRAQWHRPVIVRGALTFYCFNLPHLGIRAQCKEFSKVCFLQALLQTRRL